MYSFTLAEQVASKFTGTGGTGTYGTCGTGGTGGIGGNGGTGGTGTYGTGTYGTGCNGTYGSGTASLLQRKFPQNLQDCHPNPSPYQENPHNAIHVS